MNTPHGKPRPFTIEEWCWVLCVICALWLLATAHGHRITTTIYRPFLERPPSQVFSTGSKTTP